MASETPAHRPRVFFDISIGDNELGRIVFELYNDGKYSGLPPSLQGSNVMYSRHLN